MRHLKTVLEELDVTYTMPLQPVMLPSSSTTFQRMRQTGGGMESREALGNARSFLGSPELYRAPTPGLWPGDSSF